jgi:hypothetical protein
MTNVPLEENMHTGNIQIDQATGHEYYINESGLKINAITGNLLEEYSSEILFTFVSKD